MATNDSVSPINCGSATRRSFVQLPPEIESKLILFGEIFPHK